MEQSGSILLRLQIPTRVFKERKDCIRRRAKNFIVKEAVLEDPDGWLDDECITAAQHLLQEQHPDVAGLQSTSLQYTRTFYVHRDHPFVQCLHENGNHWITVSTVGWLSGVDQVFDSSHRLKLSHSL
ncbi:hypothetical protein EMCRGX_G006768 [Ephydatia muelleri]